MGGVRSGGWAIVAAVAAWLGSGVACVDTANATDAAQPSSVSDGPAATTAATCELSPPVPYSGDAGIPFEDTTTPGPYAWKNVVIEGGGFVSGIIMSPVLPGLVFARTDVGGAYRYDPTARRWMAITDWVGHNDSNLLGIESIATDPVDPNRVYMAAGMYLTAGNGSILSSTDMGQTWTRNNISAPMGGNADGRSMGERLAVDPNLTSTLYFGSRSTGLWKSTDSAHTWTQVTGFPTTGVANGDAGTGGYGLTFVVFDPRSGTLGSPTPAIYVGVGVTQRNALYRTTDAGATWEAVAGQPAGMMPHHAVLDGCGTLYLAYNNGSRPEQHHQWRGLAIHHGQRRLDRCESPARCRRLRRNCSRCRSSGNAHRYDHRSLGVRRDLPHHRRRGQVGWRSARRRRPTWRVRPGSCGTNPPWGRRDGWAMSRSIPSIQRALSTSPGEASGRPTTSRPPTRELRLIGPSRTRVSRKP